MNMSVAHANVRSLPCNFVDASLEPKKHSRSIMCFTETWLDASYPNGPVQVHGYHPVFCHDRVGKRGGGVAIYVSDTLSVKRISDKEIPESIFLKIAMSKSKRRLLAACYRPPSQTKR